ncbi:hypothetical protein [Saccharopolyspora sp. NPDC002376]
MNYRYAVLSDLRVPFEDSRALASLLSFLAAYRPDQVVILGGLVDDAAANADRAEVMARALANVVDPLRRCMDRRVVLLGDQCPDLPGVEWGPGITTFAPGWTMFAHQEVEKHDIYSGLPGASALKLAKRLGASVVMGSTGRLGKGSYSVGYDGEINSTVTGVEVGHLSDPLAEKHRQASTEQRWQQGFALVEVSGGTVSVEPIRMNRRGQFTVGSQRYAPPQRAPAARR